MASERQEIQALIAELRALQANLAALTARVYRLEQAATAGRPAEPSQASPGVAPEAATLPDSMPPSRARGVAGPSAVPAALPAQVGRRPAVGPGVDDALESRIGAQWLNRVGIIAVLVGVSFFLKYAFENNWIGPGTRVLVGLLAGVAVVLWSERFRRKGYEVFSYSLKAVGIGVLYLSLWAAFQLYELVPASVAFAAMAAVTAATAFLAIRQNAAVLAAFALAGGFLTPVLVSTHENREFALFSYVALLDVGVLLLIAFRPWRALALGSFFGTLLLYIGWYTSYYTRAQLDATLAFATLFFVIFSLVPVASSRREPVATPEGVISPSLVVLPLLNSALYFYEAFVMLESVSRSKAAWIAIAVAVYYLLLSWMAGAELAEQERRLVRMLHVGLAVGFVTVAIPLKLNAHWITIGWLVESAALLWIARRVNYRFLNRLAGAALVLGIIRLLVIDTYHPETVLLNERFFTYLVAIGVLAEIVRVGSGGDEGDRLGAAWAAVTINVLALIALSYEISDAFDRAAAGASAEARRTLNIARGFSYSALYMAYGAALMLAGFWRRSRFLRWQALALIAIAAVKVFVFDTSQLDRVYRILSFIILGVLLLAISFAYQRNWLRLPQEQEAEAAGMQSGDPPAAEV